MKLSEVYKYGFLGLFKAIILILLEKILRIMAIITLPLWWLKPIQRFLSDFDELIEKITNWQRRNKWLLVYIRIFGIE